MIDKAIITQVAEELKIPERVVKEAYLSYWRYIRETIQSLPLKEDLNEDEFNKLRTNFNIPSIGKLYCTFNEYINIKNKFKHIKDTKNDCNNKES